MANVKKIGTVSSGMAASHEVLGVRIDDLSRDELVALCSTWLTDGNSHTIVTPNPEFVLTARHDQTFRSRLNRADLSLPDGVGLRFAAAALSDRRLQNRHTGVDALWLLAELCAREGKRLALVGGAPGVAEAAAAHMRTQIPNLLVEGIDPGPVTERLNHSTTQSLNHFSIIALALGQGKQERVLETLSASRPLGLSASRILIGVGGALDMIAGTKRRAPSWLRQAGLEWVWRVLIEPKRWRRIFNATLIFPGVVLFDTLKHHRFLRACRATIPEIVRQLRGL